MNLRVNTSKLVLYSEHYDVIRGETCIDFSVKKLRSIFEGHIQDVNFSKIIYL